MSEIQVCPRCDGSNIEVVSSNRRSEMLPPWKCQADDCGFRFDEPEKRQPKSRENTVPHGLAKELLEMDP